jgi:hypothetical protein
MAPPGNRTCLGFLRQVRFERGFRPKLRHYANGVPRTYKAHYPLRKQIAGRQAILNQLSEKSGRRDNEWGSVFETIAIDKRQPRNHLKCMPGPCLVLEIGQRRIQVLCAAAFGLNQKPRFQANAEWYRPMHLCGRPASCSSPTSTN